MKCLKISPFPFHPFTLSLKNMRLDLFLKTSRLIPRRSLAQEFCDAGLIKVNGLMAKSSKEIKTGDEMEINRRNRLTILKVLQKINWHGHIHGAWKAILPHQTFVLLTELHNKLLKPVFSQTA